MVKRIRSFSLFVLVLLSVASAEAQSPAPSVDDFFQSFTDEWMRQNPDLVVRNQYFESIERDRLSRELTPVSRAYRLNMIHRAEDGLEQLATFDRDGMTLGQRISADVMQWQLENVVDSEPFLDFAFPLQQMNGVNVDLPNQLVVIHPIRTARDTENYIARLGQVDERLHEATAESERQAAMGIIPPRFILEATIEQMERFISPVPSENPLATTLAEKMASVDEISSTRREGLLAEAVGVIESEIYPAWREAITVLDSQLPDSNNDAGLWRFDGGAELYTQRLRTYTTTDLTAVEIHAIGLAEVERIETEMDALFRMLGYDAGSIADRETLLAEALSYPNTDAGRREIMADINAILADSLVRTADSFDLRPQTPVIAQPYPEFRWANAAASYSSPPSDGSRPGIFQMPLRPSRLTRFELRSLVYHETVPGHHFQIALATESPDLPAFRRIRALGGLSAITEGWALYAERFAAEDGWYDDDLAGLVGQMSSALFRARRLVVDTGLHAMGWTRQQAIDYGIEPSEVERYVVYPGQACAYMIGQLKIVELRERARTALGDRFSIREFHNAVLSVGAVPLTVLEQEVDAYIARDL